jgi:glycine/D-amino acid oxidase-like deaminating enzyme
MEAAARPRHMDGIRAHYEEMCAEGHADHIELIERDRIPEVLGTQAYHGGFIDRRSGHLHPLNLCLGEARAAATLGAAIFEDSPAVRIEGGAKPFVETAHGRIEASHVVIGGGAGHPFQRGRLWGITLPTGSYIICTAPLEEGLARRINPQSLAVADSNVVLDYFRTAPDRRMLFGGRCNYTNRDPGDLAATMKPRLVSVFPELRDVAIEYAWGGRIDIVITRIPAIGRLEPNVYYMQGYCGHGVNATHIAAAIVSDAISGTAERLDLFDKVRHIPMPAGFLGNYLLALGMLYYRLKDLL